MAGAKKIFLVEDDSDIASLLQLSLKDEGYELFMKQTELVRLNNWRNTSGMPLSSI